MHQTLLISPCWRVLASRMNMLFPPVCSQGMVGKSCYARNHQVFAESRSKGRGGWCCHISPLFSWGPFSMGCAHTQSFVSPVKRWCVRGLPGLRIWCTARGSREWCAVVCGYRHVSAVSKPCADVGEQPQSLAQLERGLPQSR